MKFSVRNIGLILLILIASAALFLKAEEASEMAHESSEQIDTSEELAVQSSTTEPTAATSSEDVSQDDAETEEPAPWPETTLTTSNHVRVIDSCGPSYSGSCLRVRSAPTTESEVVGRLRDGVVLKVGEPTEDSEGRAWYPIVFDEWIRHPDRVAENQYIAAAFVEPVEESALEFPASDGNKRIVVDLSAQQLTAYEGDQIFMQEPVSTGKLGNETPRGTFPVFNRVPSRYMQGPIEGVTDDEYDLPGVPWNLYFTQGGAVIHGAYWHNKFGQHWSHGCVNLPPEKAQKLYSWTPEGTPVTITDSV